MSLSTQDTQAIFNAIQTNQDTITTLRARVAKLEDALRSLRNNVDVSTIRPGKRVEARWIELIDQADAALKS